MADLPGAPSPPEALPVAASPPPSLSEAELLARFFRALGDPTRLRLLTLLLEGERPVTDLVEAVGAPQGRVSTHLGCLRWCGLVTARREGRQMMYAITDPRVRALLGTAGAMLRDYAAGVASCGVIR
jgi:DNA-binding transcriptional ArsR family regulator